MELKFRIPRPPSKKNRMAYAGGRVFPRKEVKEAERTIAMLARIEAQSVNWVTSRHPIYLGLKWIAETDEVEVAVRELFHPPTKRRFDIQNLPETICDALQKCGLIANDKQIAQLFITEGDLLS